MGLLEFSKLPVNTLVGADWKTFKTLTEGQEIASDKRTKFLLTKAVCRLLSTLSFVQDRRFRKTLADKPLQHDPVFILGHWRSGTTFVHNVLSCDKHFGYCTTYQTVFPHFIMFGQGLFKPTMGWLMPNKRPTDNMELAPDLPQEEEFALQNACPYTYYNFWIFPKRMMEYARRFLTFETATEEEKSAFRKAFDRMVRIALWNTGGTQFLSKNPPHTGRIREILKMSPNANFIYAGSKRDVMSLMFHTASRPFYESAITMSLDPIPEETYVAFASRLFQRDGRTIDAEVVQKVYDDYEGCTWFVQMIMNELFAMTPPSHHCAPDLLPTAQDNIIQAQRVGYQETLMALSAKQRRLLIAIARERRAEGVTSSAFIKKYSLSSASSVQSALRPLVESGLVTCGNNQYRVYDYFLAEWIRMSC